MKSPKASDITDYCQYCQTHLVSQPETIQPYGKSTLATCPRCGQYATETITDIDGSWVIRDTEKNVMHCSGEIYNHLDQYRENPQP